MTRRRNDTTFFSVTLLALSGTAFIVGNHLRQQSTRHLGQPSQIAQARTGRYAMHVAPLPHPTAPTDDADDARRTFDTVYSLVKQHFVDKLPSDRTMSQSAVRSMLSSLNDPNCFFLEPEQFLLLNNEGRGRFGGIGATFFVRGSKRDGYTDYKIVVVSPVPGSPAERAGLKPGDVITHIDGKWVLGFDPYLKANQIADRLRKREDSADSDALRQEVETARKRVQGGISLLNAQMVLRGDAQTLAKLRLPSEKRSVTVERSGQKSPITVELTPQTTEVPALTAKTLTDGTLYIRIPLFTEQTVEQFKAAVGNLPKDRGLVLDLRGNAGGLLEAAMSVEAMLSPGNAFGYELTSGGKQSSLKPSDRASGTRHPVAVLVDRGTASVAEALAAALADSGTGTIVGGQTFGDATVQMAYSLPDGSAFVLTTGKMLSPRKTDWAASGLVPKVALAPNAPEDQVLGSAMTALREHTQVATNRVQP